MKLFQNWTTVFGELSFKSIADKQGQSQKLTCQYVLGELKKEARLKWVKPILYLNP